MSLLEGKKAVIFGIGNDRSIAWGITQAFHKHGAEVGISYANETMGKRAIPLAESLDLKFIEPCDVSNDAEIEEVAQKAKDHFGEVDILVHAVAFADRHDLSGRFSDISRDGFHLAMDISVFSFIALSAAFEPFMPDNGSIMTLTYLGAARTIPSYNVMGVAKAALESATRYLARDFGPRGIRVNAISAGPIRTLASSGVSGFRSMYKNFAEMATLRQEVSIDDVGGTAVYFASDLSTKVTGEVHYVDAGFNIVGIPDSLAEGN